MKYMMMFIGILLLVTACSPFSKKEIIKDDQIYTVKVLYYDTNSFMNKYGDIYMANNPNVLIDVIPLPRIIGNSTKQQEEIFKLIQFEQPDIIFTPNIDWFRELIEKNQLMDLGGTILYKPIFDKIHHGVLNSIKTTGKDDEKIYGITRTFMKKGLYYNVDLMESNKVTLPTDKMTWDEILTLSERFKGSLDEQGESVTGLILYDYLNLFQVIVDIATTNQIPLVDVETGIQFNQKDWHQIVSRVVTGVQDGYISIPVISFNQTQEEEKRVMLFHSGRAGMMLGFSGYVNNIGNNFKWEVVTEPVNSTRPDDSYSVQLSDCLLLIRILQYFQFH